MVWSIIVGGFIGFVAGLIGSFVGQRLFGTWGPALAGKALIPSILGAVIVIAIVVLFFGKKS